MADQSTFETRSESGTRAERLVADWLKGYDCWVGKTGIETEASSTRQQLNDLLRDPAVQEQRTFTDIALRWWLQLVKHGPDLLAHEPDKGYFVVEVKSRDKPSPRGVFMLDATAAWSLAVRRCWNELAPPEFKLPPLLLLRTVVAFVDLPTRRTWCCWAEQLPPPQVVNVPQVGDSDGRRSRTQMDLPFAELLSVDWGGSGNPCIEIPDSAPYLKPIDQFLEQELGLAAVGAPEPEDEMELMPWPLAHPTT